jgi:capsular polysaccharide biosynthesis protein
MTDVLTVGALGSMLLTRWKLIVAFVVLGVGAGVAYGMLAPATYTSKAVLFVIATPADKDGYYQAAQFAEKRAATYPALLNAPEVLDRTRTALDLDMPASALIPMLTATNPTDSSLVEVSATAGTPELAQQLAGTAAQYLADYAVDLEDSGTKVGAVTIKMAVPAREPQYPSSPSPMVLGALGGLAGGALGVVAALTANAWKRRPRGDGMGKADAVSTPVVSAGPTDAGAAGHVGHAPASGGAHAAGHPPPTPAAAPADDDTDADPRPGDGITGPPRAAQVDEERLPEPRTTALNTGSATARTVPATHPRKRKRRLAHAPAGPVRVENGVSAPASAGSPATDDAAEPAVPATAEAEAAPAPDDIRSADAPDDDGDGRPTPQNGRPAPTNGQPVADPGPPAGVGTGTKAPRTGWSLGRARTSARGR